MDWITASGKLTGRCRESRKIGNQMPLTPEQMALLESMIDKYSLADVLDSLASIAFAKAEHISSNWQDESLAKVWDKAAGCIETAANREAIRTVSRR